MKTPKLKDIHMPNIASVKMPLLGIAATALAAGIAYKLLSKKNDNEPGGTAVDKDEQKGESTVRKENNPEKGAVGKIINHAAQSAVHAGQAVVQGKQALNAVKDSALGKFKNTAVERLEHYEKRLAEAKDKLEDAGDDIKHEYKKVVDDLEKRGQKIKSRIKELKEDGKDKWQDVKREINDEFGLLYKELRGIKL